MIRKVIRIFHPDKLSTKQLSGNENEEHVVIFTILSESYNRYKQQNDL